MKSSLKPITKQTWIDTASHLPFPIPIPVARHQQPGTCTS
jgi:hypothetical protein